MFKKHAVTISVDVESFLSNVAFRHLAAKRHPWTETDSKQSSLISSNLSCQEMTQQVKADT